MRFWLLSSIFMFLCGKRVFTRPLNVSITWIDLVRVSFLSEFQFDRWPRSKNVIYQINKQKLMYLLNINHKVAPPFSVNMPRKLPERTVLRQGKFREIGIMHSKSIFVQSIFIWCAQIVRFFQFSNSIQLPLAGQRTAAPGQKIDEINRCDLRLNYALVTHFLSLPYFC